LYLKYTLKFFISFVDRVEAPRQEIIGLSSASSAYFFPSDGSATTAHIWEADKAKSKFTLKN
jgi:hypothetical protein